MMLIYNSFKRAVLLSRKNIRLVVILFFMQLLFFSVMAFVQINYTTKVVENAQLVVDYMQQQDLSEEEVAKSFLEDNEVIDDFMLLKNYYDKMLLSVIALVVYSFLIFAIGNGLIWSLTDEFFEKKKAKEFVAYVGKFVLLYSLYVLVMIILFFIGLNANLDALVPTVLSVVAAYFMFISFSLIKKEARIKDILIKTYKIGLKKAHIAGLGFILSIIVIAAFSWIMFISVNANMVVLVLTSILGLLSFVFTKIFFMGLNRDIERTIH